MPLMPGGSREAMSQNIKTEMTEGNKPQKQAVAIAYAEARRTGGGQKVGVRPPQKKVGVRKPGG